MLNILLDAVRDDASHPLYSLVSVVGDLIEAYEVIGDGEVATLEAADKAVRAAIDVDDFSPEDLTGHAAVEVRMASTA